MDADLRELAEILAKAPRENNLTVKWAVVIGIFVAVCSFLFVGYGSNANRLTKLETQYDFTVKAVADLKASQARVEILVGEIRYDQLRRDMKGK